MKKLTKAMLMTTIAILVGVGAVYAWDYTSLSVEHLSAKDVSVEDEVSVDDYVGIGSEALWNPPSLHFSDGGDDQIYMKGGDDAIHMGGGHDIVTFHTGDADINFGEGGVAQIAYNDTSKDLELISTEGDVDVTSSVGDVVITLGQ